MLGCRIDGCHSAYVRVPFADTGLTPIPSEVSDEDALFVGDILSSGYFGAELADIHPGDTVAVIGAGPVGLCAAQCARLLGAKQIILIDLDDFRLQVAQENGLADILLNPIKHDIESEVRRHTQGRGADGVVEAAGGKDTFETAWYCRCRKCTVKTSFSRPEAWTPADAASCSDTLPPAGCAPIFSSPTGER